MKLKLSDWASLAEVVGAIAIVISLIYVGVQVNDSTRAVRSATANETTNAISAWYENVGNNQQSVQVFLGGLTEPDSLSPEEWLRFVYLAHAILLKYQTAYYLAQQGTLDNDMSQSITSTLSGMRNLQGFHKYWEQRRNVFEPEFRGYVEDVIANGTTDRGIEAQYLPNRG